MTVSVDAEFQLPEGPTDEEASIAPRVLSLSRVTDGMQECGQFDLEEVARLSALFLQRVALLTVERKSGDPFKTTVTMAAEVRKELLEYLNKSSNAYEVESKKTLVKLLETQKRVEEEGLETKEPLYGGARRKPPDRVIVQMLDEFLEKKRNFFTSLSSKIVNGSKVDEKVECLARELEEQQFWPEQRRVSLAKVMIQRVDTVNMNHCDAQFLGDQLEALTEHRIRCRFAPSPCPNAGCNRIGSAMHIQEHDSICPWKLLPCVQNCSLPIHRGKMLEHTSTSCRMKPVTCPFGLFGCSLSLTQGQLEEHLSAGMHSHLLMLLQSHLELKVRHEAQGAQLTEAEELLSSLQATNQIEAKAAQRNLHDCQAKLRHVESEVHRLGKEVKAANNNHEVSKLRAELRGFVQAATKA